MISINSMDAPRSDENQNAAVLVAKTTIRKRPSGRRILTAILFGIVCGLISGRALADPNVGISAPLSCPAFSNAAPLAAQQTDREAIERFQQIMREVRSGPHKILFLGDSLTRKWDPAIWRRDFAPRGALNAGVNLDRTENLLWRLEHGNLVGQHPKAVVLLIGTNDISRNRPAGIIAENIRRILKLLRSREPVARILLLGVLPRGESPHFFRRPQVRAVNELIKTCADSRHIFYDNAGRVLLDADGRLSRAISPDGVHLTSEGYARLTPQIERQLDRIPAIPKAAPNALRR